MLSQQGPAIPFVQFGRRVLSILCGSAGQAGQSETGFAVLRWWDNGVHDLFGYAALPRRAQAALNHDERFWRRDPGRPAGWAVIPVSAAEVSGHDPYGCCSSRCPGADRVAAALCGARDSR
jgi:hypothetical protein